MRLILDIGIGKLPWYKRLAFSQSLETLAHEVLEDFYDSIYYGIDREITPEETTVEFYIENGKESNPAIFIKTCSNATLLEFTECMFDIVILSDILTIPEDDWCMCENDCECSCRDCKCGDNTQAFDDTTKICCLESCQGVSAETKWQILCEAIRVLKTNGILVIACYQTHENATVILKKIFNNLGALGLKQTNMLDKRYMSAAGELRGTHEIIFEKI